MRLATFKLHIKTPVGVLSSPELKIVLNEEHDLWNVATKIREALSSILKADVVFNLEVIRTSVTTSYNPETTFRILEPGESL